MNTQVDVDLKKIKKALDSKDKSLNFALCEQILSDSNYYIPKDTGTLEESGSIKSNYNEGYVKWSTPYARRLYYGVDFNFSTDVNPNARAMWFEHAKSLHMDDWIKLGLEQYEVK